MKISVERPILFSGPMVRAILAGKKTQTRRWFQDSKLPEGLETYALSDYRMVDGYVEGRKGDEPFVRLVGGQGRAPECAGNPVRCPYGEPGDRLWVKETFYHQPDFHGEPCTWFRADHDTFSGMWTPSIFMPRKLSRITLVVIAVRIEPLQHISDADALDEGVEDTDESTARMSFARLWDSINGKTYPWDTNPWVWVIEFRKL